MECEEWYKKHKNFLIKALIFSQINSICSVHSECENNSWKKSSAFVVLESCQVALLVRNELLITTTILLDERKCRRKCAWGYFREFYDDAEKKKKNRKKNNPITSSSFQAQGQLNYLYKNKTIELKSVHLETRFVIFFGSEGILIKTQERWPQDVLQIIRGHCRAIPSFST